MLPTLIPASVVLTVGLLMALAQWLTQLWDPYGPVRWRKPLTTLLTFGTASAVFFIWGLV